MPGVAAAPPRRAAQPVPSGDARADPEPGLRRPRRLQRLPAGPAVRGGRPAPAARHLGTGHRQGHPAQPAHLRRGEVEPLPRCPLRTARPQPDAVGGPLPPLPARDGVAARPPLGRVGTGRLHLQGPDRRSVDRTGMGAGPGRRPGTRAAHRRRAGPGPRGQQTAPPRGTAPGAHRRRAPGRLGGVGARARPRTGRPLRQHSPGRPRDHHRPPDPARRPDRRPCGHAASRPGGPPRAPCPHGAQPGSRTAGAPPPARSDCPPGSGRPCRVPCPPGPPPARTASRTPAAPPPGRTQAQLPGWPTGAPPRGRTRERDHRYGPTHRPSTAPALRTWPPPPGKRGRRQAAPATGRTRHPPPPSRAPTAGWSAQQHGGAGAAHRSCAALPGLRDGATKRGSGDVRHLRDEAG